MLASLQGALVIAAMFLVSALLLMVTSPMIAAQQNFIYRVLLGLI